MREAKSLTLKKDRIIGHWSQEAKSPGSSTFLDSFQNVTIEDYKDSYDMLNALLPTPEYSSDDGPYDDYASTLERNPNHVLKAEVTSSLIQGEGASKIISNLFLSGENFRDLELLTMIVNMSPDKKLDRSGEVSYPASPGANAGQPKIGAEEIGDMSVTIPVVKAIVACLINNQPVLVHCSSGKDRSPLIVTLALMVLYNASAQDAYRFVQIKRPVVGTRAEHQPRYWEIITDFEQNTLSHLQSEIANWRDSPPDHSQLIQEAQAAAAEAQASIDAREQSRPSALERGLGGLGSDSNFDNSSNDSDSVAGGNHSTADLPATMVGSTQTTLSDFSSKTESTRNWCATFGLAAPGAVLLTLSGLASTLAVRAAQSTELASVPFKLSDFFNGQSQVAAFCNTPLGYVAIGVCAVAGALMLYAAYQQTSPSQGSERSQELL